MLRSNATGKELLGRRPGAGCRFGSFAGSGDCGKAMRGGAASLALVSECEGNMLAGLELVLRDEHRLRISQGVKEETLRAVLAALEP